jgi:hypothetical protein
LKTSEGSPYYTHSLLGHASITFISIVSGRSRGEIMTHGQPSWGHPAALLLLRAIDNTLTELREYGVDGRHGA